MTEPRGPNDGRKVADYRAVTGGGGQGGGTDGIVG